MRKRTGFTLVELLVVISIIAMLLAILIPSLNKARGSAQRVVCLNQLKTIGMSNMLYANDFNGKFVPACDATMVDPVQRSWNVNKAFLKYMGLTNNQGQATVNGYQMQDKYLCPTDLQVRKENVWKISNKVSYGYNMSDWTWNETKEPFSLAGNIPYSPTIWRGLVMSKIKKPSEKFFFCESQDIWVIENQSNYKTMWDKAGSNTVAYKNHNPPYWQVVYYRHFEGANVLFCDGRVAKLKKEQMFFYNEAGTPDTTRNDSIWFTDPSNRTKPAVTARM
jgi:prepilin-type N-terminal cleavage/methylation domain-containing protein/prepilin-type processing-associated H-X9-DG protein